MYTRSIAYTFFGVVRIFARANVLALSDMKQGLRARVAAAQFGKSLCKLFCLVLRTKVLELRLCPANVAYAEFSCWVICSFSKTPDVMDTRIPLPKRLISLPSVPSDNSGWYHKYFDPALFAAIMMFWMQAVQKWF